MRMGFLKGSTACWLLFCGGLAVGIPGLWLLADPAKPSATPGRLAATQATSVKELFSGRIHLAGVVVDEAGNPLESVTMRVDVSRLDLGAESFFASEDTKKTIRGRFDERCSGCSSLTLTFTKAGYFEEEVSYSVRSEELSREPGTDKVNKTDIRVILMSEGRRAPLRKTGGGLSGGPVDRMEILKVEPSVARFGPSQVVLRSGQLYSLTARGSDTTDQSPLKVPYVYLASPQGLGAPFKAASRPYPSGSGRSIPSAPVSVLLCASQEGDGFVVYEPKRPHLAYREMREAPATGYERCIAAPIWPAERTVVFFYCRVGSFYGKGQVRQASFSGVKPGVVEAPVWLLMNPQGTRNVAGEP